MKSKLVGIQDEYIINGHVEEKQKVKHWKLFEMKAK